MSLRNAALMGASGLAAAAALAFAAEERRTSDHHADMQRRADIGEFVCENHPDKLWPSECDCGAGMPKPGTTYGEKLPTETVTLPVELENEPVEIVEEPARPEGMPEGTPSWRENVTRLAEAVAISPLPTRQLKRMAAKQLAKSLSSVARIQERKDRVTAKKRARAEAAHARYKAIHEHVPTKG